MVLSSAWVDSAERELLALQAPGGGWPYRLGQAPAVESSALAALAMLAQGPSTGEARRQAALDAAERITRAQRSDGALGISLTRREPGWSTPFALLLWQALGVHQERVRAGVDWLRSVKGETLKRSEDPERVVGHDTTIVGWPWVVHTHSWLEPTAMAVLALERRGETSAPRVIEGRALIRDRAIREGGWNYGNKSVFGRPLRPQPGPTGLALLALARPEEPLSNEVRLGRSYLHATLPGLRASISIGWGLLGLRAWGERPRDADAWLEASYQAATGRPDAPVKLAMLLLAAGSDALTLLGRVNPNDGRGDRS